VAYRGCADTLFFVRPCCIFLGKVADGRLGGADDFPKSDVKKSPGKIPIPQGGRALRAGLARPRRSGKPCSGPEPGGDRLDPCAEPGRNGTVASRGNERAAGGAGLAVRPRLTGLVIPPPTGPAEIQPMHRAGARHEAISCFRHPNPTAARPAVSWAGKKRRPSAPTAAPCRPM
jgi:hypothetical protein